MVPRHVWRIIVGRVGARGDAEHDTRACREVATTKQRPGAEREAAVTLAAASLPGDANFRIGQSEQPDAELRHAVGYARIVAGGAYAVGLRSGDRRPKQERQWQRAGGSFGERDHETPPAVPTFLSVLCAADVVTLVLAVDSGFANAGSEPSRVARRVRRSMSSLASRAASSRPRPRARAS